MKCYIDGIVVGGGNQSPFAVAFFISVKRHKLSCYVRENTSPTLQYPFPPSPFPACCQLLLFCLLSICNKCICDVKDACDMRYSTTASKRRTHLSQGATACSSSSSCCCCREKETLATHIFVLVLALFAVVVAFVVVRCAVVRLICDTFRIILVAASTKVCLLFRYVSSLPPFLLQLLPLRLKLLPLFHCQQDSQSLTHRHPHTLHVRILNVCASVHPCLCCCCCCYSEACDSWPNRLSYARG